MYVSGVGPDGIEDIVYSDAINIAGPGAMHPEHRLPV